MPEAGNKKPEARNEMLETRSKNQDIGDKKPDTEIYMQEAY
jgi:hypothetical protein